MPKSLKLLPSLRLPCIVPIIGAAGIIAAAPAAASQELKVNEQNTTQTITDVGASGDSAGDILTFGQNEVFDADDKNKVGFDQGIWPRAPVYSPVPPVTESTESPLS
jgi:allene oxide cyclase